LREQAKAVLGEKFAIHDFHRAVLENGAVPLPVLGLHISRWQADVAKK
jgi:uncharacterized protein (DUF885 family)